VRIAAIGDLHVTEDSVAPYARVFEEASAEADVLVLCGDLTNFGKTTEAEILGEDIAKATIPVIGVLGNHDYECGVPEEVSKILGEAGVRMLGEQATVIEGVGFAGVKGFVGGFGRGELGPFGENAIKTFVDESREEARKLENALRSLRAERVVAVLHYSPIPETVEGEPLEIYPFLGCRRLEEPLNRYPLDGVFHGHAHHGAPEGTTREGIPVYNVSVTLLRKSYPDKPPFRIFEIAVD